MIRNKILKILAIPIAILFRMCYYCFVSKGTTRVAVERVSLEFKIPADKKNNE